MPRGVKWATEEERRAAIRASKVKYRASTKGQETEAAGNRAWREANPDKVKANNERWNPGRPSRAGSVEANKYSAAHYRANKERRRETCTTWREGNRDRVNEYQRRRRARVNGSEPDLTLEQWQEILEEFGDACAYCQARGVLLEKEHMTPISRGGRHTKTNVVPACRSCNARKGSKTLLEFAASG